MKFRHVLKYIMLVCFVVSCTKSEKLKITSAFVEFATDVNITLFGINGTDSMKASEAVSDVRKIFAYFNSEMNPYVENSSLSRINSQDPGSRFEIPEPLREILKISIHLYKYTDKYFDVAILPVVELWGFYTAAEPSVPDEKELSDILKISTLDSYEFTGDSLEFKDGRCRIGLGGIAKGYAVDSAASYLYSRGYRDFIVEAGGDLTVRSPKSRMIGIRHPRKERSLIDTIYVADGAVATSGDYEKFIIADGVRYCHIINPDTGFGISDLISVTVISEKTYLSDAFATAAFAMGRKKAEYILEKNKLSGLLYYKEENGGIGCSMINMEKYLKKDQRKM